MKAKKLITMIATTLLKVVLAYVIVVAVYKGSVMAYEYGYRVFAEEPISNEPGLTMTVAIVEGKSVMDIANVLEEKGLIRDAKLFYIQERLSEYHKKLKPGIYELSTAMTPYDMMQIMSATSVTDSSEESLDSAGSVPDTSGADTQNGEENPDQTDASESEEQ